MNTPSNLRASNCFPARLPMLDDTLNRLARMGQSFLARVTLRANFRQRRHSDDKAALFGGRQYNRVGVCHRLNVVLIALWRKRAPQPQG